MIRQSESRAALLRSIRQKASRAGLRAAGAALLLVAAGFWTGCGGGPAAEPEAPPTPPVVIQPIPQPPAASFERSIGGEVFHVSIRGEGEDATARAAAAAARTLAEADRLAKLLLADVAASEIDVLNRIPSHLFIQLAPETVAALTRALEIAEATDGAYDPTTPPLLDLWGVRRGPVKVPRQFEIDIALRRVDWLEIELGEDGTSARRLSRRTEVDLGPVGRGAVVDGALAMLRADGIGAAQIRWGPVTAAYTDDGIPWPFAIHASDGETLATLDLYSGAAAAIVPQRHLEGPGGEAVHEWMDGRTGRPATAARMAAAVAPDAATAGGYALAVFCLAAESATLVAGVEQVEAVAEMSSGARWQSAEALARWPRQ